MIYAPILITTLNRYDCLKKCIESLQNNSWADKTELFISVDYPPSDKYFDGYRKIKNYLNGNIKGFRKVNVFYHDKNLGPIDNVEWLRRLVCKSYDRYIFLEDDNELAPCFLEFCDKGLEEFEDDNTILALNASDYVWCGGGYTPPVRIVSQGEINVEKRQLVFHAVAYWENKRKKAQEFCEYIEKRGGNLNYREAIKLYNKSKCFFYNYLAMVVFQQEKLPWHKHHLQPIDFMIDIYMLLNDKFVLCPIEPLQRDLGVDGNGVNYQKVFNNASELKRRAWLDNHHYNFCIEKEVPINNNELILHDQNIEVDILSKIKMIVKYMKRKI